MKKCITASAYSILMIFFATVAQGQWEQIASLPNTHGIYVASLLASNGYIFADVTKGDGPVGNIYRSSDNGRFWTELHVPTSSINNIYSIGFCGSVLFADAIDSGVFYSINNGNDWTATNGLPKCLIQCFAVMNGDFFIGTVATAAGSNGIYRSSDNGKNWIAVNNGLPMNIIPGVSAVNFVTKGDSLFVAVNNDDSGKFSTAIGNIYLSTDNGDNWKSIIGKGIVSEIDTNYSFPYKFPLQIDTIIDTITYTPIEYDTLRVQIMSFDTIFVDYLPTYWIGSFAVNQNNLLANLNTQGTRDGIFKSTDGGNTWRVTDLSSADSILLMLCPNSIANERTTCILYDSTYELAGFSYYPTTIAGVFYSTDAGQSWSTPTHFPASTNVSTLAVSGSDLFVGTSDTIFHSSDYGVDWTTRTNIVDQHNKILDVQALALSGNNVFAGTSTGGVFISSDSGADWSAVNYGLTNSDVYALSVADTNLYAGTENGVFLSTNQGSSWNEIDNGFKFDVLASAASDTNYFVATFGGGLFRTTNYGASWISVNNGLKSTLIYGLAMHDTNLYAGTENGGVYLSHDNGITWEAVNYGLPANSSVFALTTMGSSLYIGTENGGIWGRTFSDIIMHAPSVVSSQQSSSSQFSISDNAFVFDADNQPHALRIYDILGRTVFSAEVNANQATEEVPNLEHGTYLATYNGKCLRFLW